ncbi:MAG: leucyl aminopeptidase, partial [Pseudomonadota bacterium]
MTDLPEISFVETDLEAIAGAEGSLAVLVTPDGKLDRAAGRVNRLTKGALARLAESEVFEKLEEGAVHSLSFPAGMAVERLMVAKLSKGAAVGVARQAGANMAKAAKPGA